jgi:hypothetical protein
MSATSGPTTDQVFLLAACLKWGHIGTVTVASDGGHARRHSGSKWAVAVPPGRVREADGDDRIPEETLDDLPRDIDLDDGSGAAVPSAEASRFRLPAQPATWCVARSSRTQSCSRPRPAARRRAVQRGIRMYQQQIRTPQLRRHMIWQAAFGRRDDGSVSSSCRSCMRGAG